MRKRQLAVIGERCLSSFVAPLSIGRPEGGSGNQEARPFARNRGLFVDVSVATIFIVRLT